MRNAITRIAVVLPVLMIAYSPVSVAQEGSSFKPEIDAYLACINTQVVGHQTKAGYKINDATAVIDACSAARRRLRIESQNSPTVEELIRGVEAHLKMREQAVDNPTK